MLVQNHSKGKLFMYINNFNASVYMHFLFKRLPQGKKEFVHIFPLPRSRSNGDNITQNGIFTIITNNH